MSDPNQIRNPYPDQTPFEPISQAPACPNCWGWQEYAERRRLGPNSKWNQTKAFILNFVEQVVSGIRKPDS